MGKIKYYLIVGAVCLLTGLFIGNRIIKSGHTDKTGTNQGNIIAPPMISDYTNLVFITNHYTKWLTNVITLVIDDSNYRVDPFIWHQVNDEISVSLYNRHDKTTLQQWQAQPSWMITGILNPSNAEYGAAGQYRIFGQFWVGLEVREKALTNIDGNILISIGL